MRHLKFLILIIVGLAVQAELGSSFAANPRVALVIGNSAYREASLANPANDARLIAATLRNLGFEVMERIDADQRTMKYTIALAVSALGMPADASASTDRARPTVIITARISTLTIRTLLEQRGYTKIGRILLSGAVYKVVARDRRGRRVKLFVDPQTARILRKVLICE